MMNEIIYDVTRVVVVVIATVIARYLIPWLKAQLNEHTDENINGIIMAAVLAAQQTIGDNEEKKKFVFTEVSKWLSDHGITIDAAQLDMLIEAAVYTMKQESK